MAITNSVTVNLEMDSPNNLVLIHAVQGEYYSRQVTANLYNNGSRYTIPSEAIALIRYRKPDASVGFYDFDPAGNRIVTIPTTGTYANKRVIFTIAPEMCDTPGRVFAHIDLYSKSSGNRLSAFYFELEVEKAATDPEIYKEANVGGVQDLLKEIIGSVYTPSETPQDGAIIDNTLSIPGAVGDAKAMGDVVLIQDSQPGEEAPTNKIWIDSDSYDDGVEVPEMAEFQKLNNSFILFSDNFEEISPSEYQDYAVQTPAVGSVIDWSDLTYSSSTAHKHIVHDFQEGDKVTIDTVGSSSYRKYMIVDAQDTVIALGSGSGHEVIELIAPENSKKILINYLGTQTPFHVVFGITIKDVEEMIDQKQDLYNEYEGCKLSLLGDSLSAYRGWVPSGNNVYYPNVNSDIDDVSQMWWKIVCDKMSMEPLVINAWSGSGVTAGIREPTSSNLYTPASDVSRCQALHALSDDEEEIDPDIILLAIGTNDFSYMSNMDQFGSWDGHSSLGNSIDQTLSDYINTDFRAAYATMIARIQKRYPQAMVCCLTLFFNQRRNTTTGVTYLNTIGKTLEDYNMAIREIAGQMFCPVIEVTNIGFSRRNFYPTYAMDSQYTATHMTIAGHKELAASVIKQLNNLHRFGSTNIASN